MQLVQRFSKLLVDMKEDNTTNVAPLESSTSAYVVVPIVHVQIAK